MKRKFQVGDPVYVKIIRWWPAVVVGFTRRGYAVKYLGLLGDVESASRRNVIARND